MATASCETYVVSEDLHGPHRVDRDQAIVFGVKLCGLESKNQIKGKPRRYSEAALRRAVPLYEGVQVYEDHDYAPNKGVRKARPVSQVVGRIRNVEFRSGQGLFGDVFCVRRHRMTESLLDEVEEARGGYGFSHFAEGSFREEKGSVVCEDITQVFSVDLVSSAATTKTLFESEESEAMAANWRDEIQDVDPQEIFRAKPKLIAEALDTHGGELRDQASKAIERAEAAEKRIEALEAEICSLQGQIRKGQAGTLLESFGISSDEKDPGLVRLREAIEEKFASAKDEEAANKVREDYTQILKSMGRKQSGPTPGKPERQANGAIQTTQESIQLPGEGWAKLCD